MVDRMHMNWEKLFCFLPVLIFCFLPVLISVGRFADFVGRFNIPSGTLRTVAGCCGEDTAWVEWWCDHSAPSELVQDFVNGDGWVVDP